MRRLVQVTIVVLALATGVTGFLFAQRLTVRNIASPSEQYSVAYAARGGTVYITESENRLLTTAWVVGAALVAVQLILNATARRTRRVEPRS